MTGYSENIFYLNDYYFVLEGTHLAKIKNKFSELNLFYKQLIQKHEILLNKRKRIL